MPRTTTKLHALRRKARTNSAEVEDVLAVAASGTRADAAALRLLADEHQWSRGPGGHGQQVPLGTWVDVTCAFLESGFAAVDAFASDQDRLAFALGLLSKQRIAESVDVLNALADRFADTESRTKIAAALNLVCSFRGSPDLSPAASARARAWIHALLAGPPLAQAIAACALRGVGDAESIALLSRMERLPPPWAGIEQQAIRAIKKRARRDSLRPPNSGLH